jgi:hypothetical protein
MSALQRAAGSLLPCPLFLLLAGKQVTSQVHLFLNVFLTILLSLYLLFVI